MGKRHAISAYYRLQLMISTLALELADAMRSITECQAGGVATFVWRRVTARRKVLQKLPTRPRLIVQTPRSLSMQHASLALLQTEAEQQSRDLQ